MNVTSFYSEIVDYDTELILYLPQDFVVQTFGEKVRLLPFHIQRN